MKTRDDSFWDGGEDGVEKLPWIPESIVEKERKERKHPRKQVSHQGLSSLGRARIPFIAAELEDEKKKNITKRVGQG